MKKGIIVLVLALVVASGVFAQEEKSASARINWISGELSLLGIGARYERMLNENWSVGANVYWSSFFILFNELELGLSARYYPWGKTFFAGLGLGFHTQTGTYEFKGEGYSNIEMGNISGVAISPEVGWKIDVGNVGGFYIQPGAKLPITLGSLNAVNRDVEFRASVGFVAYFGMGYAF
jgi:hypothetical protein